MGRGVKRGRVKDGDTIPARLNLDGKVALESLRRIWMVENTFKWGILKSRAIDISSNPIIIKDGGADLLVIHVIGSTCDTCVVPAALPDELQEVVDAGQDVVHEDDGIKELIL